MPESPKFLSLFATILYESRNSKSLTTRFFSPSFAMRKLFPFAGFSFVVLPVMAPSSTDQCSGRPSQPVRSFPLNKLLKPASDSAARKVETMSSRSEVTHNETGDWVNRFIDMMGFGRCRGRFHSGPSCVERRDFGADNAHGPAEIQARTPLHLIRGRGQNDELLV